MNLKNIALFSLFLANSAYTIESDWLKKEIEYERNIPSLSDNALKNENEQLELMTDALLAPFIIAQDILRHCQDSHKKAAIIPTPCNLEIEKFNHIAGPFYSEKRKLNAVKAEMAKRQRVRIVNGAIADTLNSL